MLQVDVEIRIQDFMVWSGINEVFKRDEEARGGEEKERAERRG